MVSYSSAKEKIKQAADLVEVIGQYVQLKKAGRNFMGLCPFHAEKDPSFTVNPERQTFHCFGCKKGGDIFTFWMEYHSTTFPEAVRDLAERYHITLTEGYSVKVEKKRAAQKEALYAANKIALDFFQNSLMHSVTGKPARNYLQKRTIPLETISEFQLGYAPDTWDGLVRGFKARRIAMQVAEQAGLVKKRASGGYYDLFRGRIMFPILDQRQQVIGFGGRVLDDSLPKYLNTPETPIFNKSTTLYGLNSSFNAIREKGRAVIVEGYMDWLALKTHGVHEVVATLGTALTDKHARKLKGLSKEVLIVFDSDKAGQSATLKSLNVFANEGHPARAVVLPEGQDPDDFINEKGHSSFEAFLDQACPLIEFFLEQKLSQDASDEEKANILKEILPVLREIRDFSLRSLYVQRLAERIGIKDEVIFSQLNSQPRASATRAGPYADNGEKTHPKKATTSDLQLLHLVVHHPEVTPRLMACNCKAMIIDPAIAGLVDVVYKKYTEAGPFSPESLLEEIENESGRAHFMEVLHRPFIMYSDEDAELFVSEFEQKARNKKINASLKKTRGDLIAQNELLKQKIQDLTP